MKKMLILALLTCHALQATTYSGKPFLSLPTDTPANSTSVFLFRDHFKPVTHTVNKKHNSPIKVNTNQKKKELRIVAFGGATTNSEDLAKYFVPFNKTTLRALEGLESTTNPNIDNGAQDIVAQNFNIENVNDSFCSDLAFSPKQTRVGVNFSGHLQLNDKFWITLSAPIIHIKNTLDMVETVTFDGKAVQTDSVGFDNVAFVANMTDAFKAPEMKYGKIDGAQKETRLADITLKLGYNFKTKEHYHIQPYLGLVVPTGNKPKAEYLFEPIVGNNKHFEVQFGTLFGRRLGTAMHRKWWVRGSVQTSYRAPNTQMRSLDLVGKPWSRYIAIYATEAKRAAGNGMPDQTWGINHLTQEVKVSPGISQAFDVALNSVCKRNYIGTFGYRLNILTSETVKLKNTWVEGPQISNLDAGLNETNPSRGINDLQDASAVAGASYITESQLDLNGAACPSSAAHSLYLLLSKPYERENRCLFVEGGINYTFGSNNATPRRWELQLGATSHF